MPDVPGRLQLGTTFENSMPILNGIFDALDLENRTKIIKNGTVPQIIFGYQQAGFNGSDYGLKISKPGIDVTSATADQFIFNSSQDVFRVLKSGTLNLTVPASPANGSTYTATVAHGQATPPAFIAYALFGGAYYGLPLAAYQFNATIGSFAVGAYIQASIDATNFIVTLGANGFSAGVYPIRYYFIQETAS